MKTVIDAVNEFKAEFPALYVSEALNGIGD